MVAISLNIQQKVHPIIWSVSNLPFDCYQAVPVKKPLGGTLIMAINSLIYLNQSIPPYGVSLNSLSDTCTNFPLSTQPIFTLFNVRLTISHNIYVIILIFQNLRKVLK
jgi:cleavage and polyadenylation specificity factor subunit 1